MPNISIIYIILLQQISKLFTIYTVAIIFCACLSSLSVVKIESQFTLFVLVFMK